ncbi:MAG: hypothetical protein ACOH19_02550 [Rhodoglobus sp.]
MTRRTLAIIAAVFAAFAVVGIAGGIWLARGMAEEANSNNQSSCSSRFGTTCESIPVEKIEAAFDLDLPDGTVVTDSSYQAFQDWRLNAVLTIPDPDYELPAGWVEAGEDEEGHPRTGVFSDDTADSRTLTLTLVAE